MEAWLKNGSFKEQDEYYTPKILVEAILPYIPEGKTVWCPFDTEDSEFVHCLKERNKVIHTHIWDGYDFFKYEPENYDVIVSNPPFSKKMEVFERLYKLDKPFAMVLPLTILNYTTVGSFFLDKDVQMLIVNKKVSFNGGTSSFNTSYYCHKLLPKDLMFVDIAHNNAGKKFVPSRMYKEI